MREKLRVAVVGLGRQALTEHVPALLSLDRVKIIALCDRDPVRIKEAQALTDTDHATPAFTDYAEMFKDTRPDFVVASLPHDQYAGFLQTAAQHKVHVFKEKPFARNLEEAGAFQELAGKSGIKIMTAFQRRFHPLYLAFNDVLQTIGKIHHIQAVYTIPSKHPNAGWRCEMARAGGGVLLDMGYHLLDLIFWYFDPIDTVHATIFNSNPHLYDVEDTASVKFEVGNISGDMFISCIYPERKDEIIVLGERGSVKLTSRKIEKFNTRHETVDVLECPMRWEAASLRQLDYFCDVVRKNKNEYWSSPAYQVANHVRVMDMLYWSARNGKTVDLGGAIPDMDNAVTKDFERADDKSEQQVVPQEFQVFPHPLIRQDVVECVIRQMHEDISLYDNGGIYARLESRLKDVFQLPNVLTTNSGTTALYSLFFGLDLKPGDNVIVPSYTFFATAAPLINMGVQIKFADCHLDNGNSDPEDIRRKIDARTRAVIVTHMWGIPCDMDDILAIGREKGIYVFEDVSHAHLASYQGKILGSFADGAAWSLQGKKNLTAGEGGMLSSRHAVFMERAVMIGHFNKRAKKEVHIPDLLPYAVTGAGCNFRMHPFGAAFALHYVDELFQQTQERREVAKFLEEEIAEIDGLANVRIPDQAQPAWYAYPVLYDQTKFREKTLQDFVCALQVAGAVEADIPGATGSLGRYELFRNPGGINGLYRAVDYRPPSPNDFKNAEKFHAMMFKIPTWYGPQRFEYAKSYVAALRTVAGKFR